MCGGVHQNFRNTRVRHGTKLVWNYWIRCFAGHARAKKHMTNKECEGENEIIDLFLTIDICEAIMKISWMTYPKEMEEVTFNQIKEIILKNMKPKK